jgi:hypothetical protein
MLQLTAKGVVKNRRDRIIIGECRGIYILAIVAGLR